MRIHWEESATTKTAPFRRNPSGAGGPPTYQTEAAGAPQALSGMVKAGHDENTAPAASVSNLGAHSSLRACNPKTRARGPRDFCHGLLMSSGRSSRYYAERIRSIGGSRKPVPERTHTGPNVGMTAIRAGALRVRR